MSILNKKVHKNHIILIIIFILSLSISFTLLSEIGFWARDTPQFITNIMFERSVFFGLSDAFTKANCFCIPINPFSFLQITVLNLRILQSIFLSLGALVSYILFKFITDSKKIALISTILLITTPFYISNSLNVYPFLPFFTILSLFLIFKFMDTEKSYYMYIAAITLGLGLSNRINVIYYISALIPSFLIINLFYNKNIFNKKFIKISAISIVLFLIATTPIAQHLKQNPYQTITEETDIVRDHRGIFETLSPRMFTTGFIEVFFTADHRLTYIKEPFTKVLDNEIWQYSSYLLTMIFLLSITLNIYHWTNKKLNKWEKFILVIFFFYMLIIFINPAETHAVYFHQIFPLIIILMVTGIRKTDNEILIIVFIILLLANGARIYQFNRITSNQQRLELKAPALSHLEKQITNYRFRENGSKVITIESERFTGLNYKVNKVHDHEIQISSIEDYGRYQNPNEIHNIFKEIVKNNTYILLPAEDWKETDASDIIYYCDHRRENNWCDNILKSFNVFIEESRFTSTNFDTIKSTSGVEVYELKEITK